MLPRPIVFAALLLLAAASAQGASFVVTTTADSGAGSLRDAIEQANATGEADTITFAPALAGQTIAPLTPLPQLNGGISIDGDLGADCIPDIALDGQSAGPTNGLELLLPGTSTVRGLAIHGFTGAGVRLGSSGNTIACNRIGTNLALATNVGNNGFGIHVEPGPQPITGNTIGPGNLIAHNAFDGIQLQEHDAGGYPEFTALTPDYTGVFPQIAFDSADPFNNEVFHTADNSITPLDGAGGPFTDHFGMRLTGELVVPTAGSHTFTVNPLDDNVRLRVDGTTELDVGGPGPHEATLNLGAGTHTIRLDFAEGVGFAAVALAIGGPGAATLNTNQQAVCPTGQPGLCGELFQLRRANVGNRITQNATRDNGGLGIRLRCCSGPLNNDAGDIDLGANTWLNSPVITGIAPAGAGLYAISGTAPANATVELFQAAIDPSGFGEGSVVLASTVATGGGTFAANVALAPGASTLTATATDAAGNTSEFGQNFTVGGGGTDLAIVGTLGAPVDITAGTVGSVPVRVKDTSLTTLGLDRPAGSRIQGLAFRIDFPPGTVSTASIAPAGITAPLTPLFGPSSSFAANSVNYLVSYEEATNPIPFTLDILPPAEQVAVLNLTVSPSAPPGPLAYTINLATELSNQAGTLAENTGNGGLSLVPYTINVVGNGPRGLYAAAQSTSTIRLTWFDANLIETGYRIERATAPPAFVTAGTVGPDVTSFDDPGLNPGTLYYYRVVTLAAGGDGNASNRATASTFPAIATRICVDPVTVSRRWARSPSMAFRGPEWGVAWHDRDDGSREQIRFQRLDGNTLAPLGPFVQVTNSRTGANFPSMAFNGTHYGVIYNEFLRGAPGSFPASALLFAQLDANGAVLRAPRRVLAPPPGLGLYRVNEIGRIEWDGTHWGVFTPEFAPPYDLAIRYRRLDVDGDVVTGPVTIAAESNVFLSAPVSAWNVATSEYGVTWVRQTSTTADLYFQRVDEATGATVLPTPAVVGIPAVPAFVNGTSLVADPAGGWLAAWSQIDGTTGDRAIYTRRIAADGTPHAAGAVRVSPGPVPTTAFDDRPVLVARPGGFALFVDTGNPPEIRRYHLDATGAPDGLGATAISAVDTRQSGRPRVASDGTRALIAWNESLTTMEVSARLSDGATGTLGAQVDLTSGHDPANSAAVVVPNQPRVAPVGAGFVALWQDPDSGANRLHGRLYDGNGAIVADFAPFSAQVVNQRPGLVGVGDSFAVAWQNANNLHFTRRAGTGAVLVPETQLVTGGVTNSVVLGWDGENYVAVWMIGGQFRYLRITEGGAAIGAPLTLPINYQTPNSLSRMAWMGDGWALLWRDNSDGNLRYARFASDGSVLLPATAITANTIGGVNSAEFGLEFGGGLLGVTWAENRGPDPPGSNNWFTVLNRDGTKAFPEVAVNAGPTFDQPAQIHWAGGRFHLIDHSEFGENLSGMREVDVNPDGSLPGVSRFLANRGSSSAAVAHNGRALAMAWRAPQTQDIHIETDTCLADPTPPPCPNVSVASVNNRVRLSWPAVTDPESGLWRYHVYRDAKVLAELEPAITLFDDSGYDTATTHAYQVRAFNRAFQESVACPALNFSTTVGDANGNGSTEVGDVFYLINFSLANGPPPLGDGDANGDNGVSVTDIFFLINFFFGGGPTPTALAAPVPESR